MRSRDGSLVLFTMLSQWSIGIIVCFTWLIHFHDGVLAITGTGLSLRNPVFVALVLIGLATTVSFLHLGNPSNAPKALKNLGGSWLSREILAIGIYSLSLLAILTATWIEGETIPGKFGLLPGAAAGLFLLWMMARLYMLPTIPAWNCWYTPLSFVTTTLSLGWLTFLLLNTVDPAGSEYRLSQVFAGFLAATLNLEIASGLVHQLRLARMNTGFDGPAFNRGVYYRLFLARMALLLFSSLAVLFFLLQSGSSAGVSHAAWIYATAALVIAQEVIGRVLFYSSYFRIGV